jgi:hypothetical protein
VLLQSLFALSRVSLKLAVWRGTSLPVSTAARVHAWVPEPALRTDVAGPDPLSLVLVHHAQPDCNVILLVIAASRYRMFGQTRSRARLGAPGDHSSVVLLMPPSACEPLLDTMHASCSAKRISDALQPQHPFAGCSSSRERALAAEQPILPAQKTK